MPDGFAYPGEASQVSPEWNSYRKQVQLLPTEQKSIFVRNKANSKAYEGYGPLFGMSGLWIGRT
jgi:hypothetical protein